MENNIYFVSGIDTNIGKSYATGVIARTWNERGVRTITQKFIQTGNVGYSEDIDLHRSLMGTVYLKKTAKGSPCRRSSLIPVRLILPPR